MTIMINDVKLKVGLVITILLLLWSTVMWNNEVISIKIQESKIDSLVNLEDSLRHESFANSIEPNRYQIALEIYREHNPKAVEEIELIKTTQTK